MTTLYDEIRELQEEIQRLQRALAFWMPSMPIHCPEPIYSRLARDIDLLIGFEGPLEVDAEELRWIKLTPPDTSTTAETKNNNG